MDKSDLLDEWDVVTVSSVYEAEKESTDGDTKIDADVMKTDEASNVDIDANPTTGSANIESETPSKSGSEILPGSESNTVTEPKNKIEIERNSDTEPERNIDAERECKVEPECETNIETEPESSTAASELTSIAASEPMSITAFEAISIAASEVISIAAFEARSIAASEPMSITASEAISIAASEAISIAASEAMSIATSEPTSIATSEPTSIATTESLSSDVAESENSAATDVTEDTEIEVERKSDAEQKVNVDTEHSADASKQIPDDDNIVEDIVHVESPTDNNLDSSEMTFEIERCEELDLDPPELVPERINIEQEMASIESSSSDIDIIDENVEESITSSFISPLSLSISSSVADTSSIQSFTSQSEDSQDLKPKEMAKDIRKERVTTRSESTEKIGLIRDVHYEKAQQENKRENVHSPRRESQRTMNRRSFFDWFALFIELFRNLSGYDWCMIGGVAVSVYLTVIVNQTNIFAVQKENVVSQMREMIDELKTDNKMLQEQMLSELKNKKALSSFEHQIRELRKENSKLSRMFYDVARVLDKQKNSHEKKEADYLAPFKKEINKLKEHINILKFDNEELQKQLVRMRYGSFAQGSTDTTESKDQSGSKGGTQAEADISDEELAVDIESLTKWNELITLLTEELRALSGAESIRNEKSHSDTKTTNSKPFWKAYFSDFKGTFNDLRKINFTAMFSEYKKANQKAVSDIYKFVKDFFSVAEHTQQYTSNEDDPQWKNIGDFIGDLKEKWTNIKDRLYTSDLKQFFQKNFKSAASEPSSGESVSQKADSATFEHADSRTTSAHFKSEDKHDQVQTPEETKWMFKRAAHREEVRNADEEVNWFLKKGRRDSEDEKEKRRF